MLAGRRLFQPFSQTFSQRSFAHTMNHITLTKKRRLFSEFRDEGIDVRNNLTKISSCFFPMFAKMRFIGYPGITFSDGKSN